jgi:hypothetical protein
MVIRSLSVLDPENKEPHRALRGTRGVGVVAVA